VRESIYYYIVWSSDGHDAFLDNENAFKSVWIDDLLYKLFKHGFDG